MRIFAEQKLSDYLEANSNRLRVEVEKQSEDYILNGVIQVDSGILEPR